MYHTMLVQKLESAWGYPEGWEHLFLLVVCLYVVQECPLSLFQFVEALCSNKQSYYENTEMNECQNGESS